MRLTDAQHAAFSRHAVQEFPKEACGVVAGGDYVPLPNTHETPTKQFRIAGADLIKVELERGPIQAVLHTHPYDRAVKYKWDPRTPTSVDMQGWLRGKTPWGIASCDGEGISQVAWLDDSEIAPLVGREFMHGIHDCYALVRDWFRLERGITLKNYARGPDWWEQDGQDLYAQNLADAGFVQINKDEATVGDCCLFQIRSKVINHAAVITGTNEILHHLFHRLSYRDSLARWDGFIVKYVRYVGPT